MLELARGTNVSVFPRNATLLRMLEILKLAIIMTFNLCKIRSSTRAEQSRINLPIAAIMPDNRRIQGPEASHCPLLYLREEEKPSGKPLVSS